MRPEMGVLRLAFGADAMIMGVFVFYLLGALYTALLAVWEWILVIPDY